MLSLARTQDGLPEVQEDVLETEKTSWGYIVREKTDKFEHETVVESSGRFLGLIFVVCAYGQWFLPAAMFIGDAVVMKGAMSFLFGATGVGMYWMASRGLCKELEVDLTRRELRVVNRNGRGTRRLQSRIGMREIESFFLRRTKASAEPTLMMVRLRQSAVPLLLAAGGEVELTDLLQQLKSDVKPVSEKLEERMARNVAFLSRRTGS